MVLSQTVTYVGKRIKRSHIENQATRMTHMGAMQGASMGDRDKVTNNNFYYGT